VHEDHADDKNTRMDLAKNSRAQIHRVISTKRTFAGIKLAVRQMLETRNGI